MLSLALPYAQDINLGNEPFYRYQPQKFNYMHKRNAKWKNPEDGYYQAGQYTNSYALRGLSDGFPAACLPGGPGSLLTSDYKEYFNSAGFRVVTSDWRGVGASQPHGPGESNNTQGLIHDIEIMRQKLGAEQLLLRGGSWGAAMAMAYSQAYPERVSGLVLGLPFLGRKKDIDWNYSASGIAHTYPEQYADFSNFIGSDQPSEILEGYSDCLNNPDPDIRKSAFVEWTKWEFARSGESFDMSPEDINEDDKAYKLRLNRARIMADYAMNGFFTSPEGILSIGQKPDVPTIIIMNDGDPLAHPDTLETMKDSFPKAEFIVQENADYHWIFNPQTDKHGRSNAFVENAYAYATDKIRRLYMDNDPDLKLAL